MLRWPAKLNGTRTGAKFTRGLQEDDHSGGGMRRGRWKVEEKEEEKEGGR